MDTNWTDSLPIYRQLRDRVVAMILEGVLNDGDPLPSVRSVAAEYRLNPLTVLKGYQQLVDERLVEKRRGRGMFVTEGARRALLKDERQLFLEEEWPKIAGRIQRLGFEPKELLDALDKIPPAPAPSLTAARDAAADDAERGGQSVTDLIVARGLGKSFGSTRALTDVNFRVRPGRIVGLIGPNGAGKTTALKALLGLTRFDGELAVLGLDPYLKRHQLMQDVCFIADVAVLPRWIRVSQLIDFVAATHPRFRREVCEHFLSRSDIRKASRVKELSKGMVTQLHLALVMAIDAKLLVLDEPTLGLDILMRKQFYETLLNEYFDEQRTILVTTHQVEEIEHILTDLLFIDRGRIVLDAAMDEVQESYAQVAIRPEHVASARTLKPIAERQGLGRTHMLFKGVGRAELERLGEVGVPSVADLFVAVIQGARA